MNATSIGAVLLAVYLGLAPVFWWPGVSDGVMGVAKLSLVALAVAFVWSGSLANRQFALPGGLLGAAGLIALSVASSFAIAQADVMDSVLRMKDFLLSYIMAWTLWLCCRSAVDTRRVVVASASIIAIHSALVVSSRFLGVPAWSGPAHFIASELWISGFSQARTGWSGSVALYIPLLLLPAFDRSLAIVPRVLAVLGAAACAVSQVIVSGRAGMLATVVGVGYLCVQRGLRIWLLAVVGVCALWAAVNPEYLYEQLRLGQGEMAVVQGQSELDALSTGRISAYATAFDLFLQHPLTGHGFGGVELDGREIHNVWLRLFVEGGLLLGLMSLAVVGTVMRNAYRLAQTGLQSSVATGDSQQLFGRALTATLLTGFVVSMFEPRFLLGAFQYGAVWWAVAGIAAASVGARGDAHAPEESAGGRLAPRPANLMS